VHFQLQGLEAAANYQFECADTGQTWRATGAELMAGGLAIAAEAPRTSRLLFYNQVAKPNQNGD